MGLRCVNGHDRCYLGPDPNCPHCEYTSGGEPHESNPYIYEDGKPKPIKDVEALLIEAAINYHRGCLSAVARTLRIGRSTLYRKLVEYNLLRPANFTDN